MNVNQLIGINLATTATTKIIIKKKKTEQTSYKGDISAFADGAVIGKNKTTPLKKNGTLINE